MIKLQNLVFPSTDIPASEDLYFRCHNGADVSLAASRIEIEKKASVSIDTFFNGFSVQPWKSHCDIKDLSIALTGSGSVRVRFGLHTFGQHRRWLMEDTITLSEEPASLNLGVWDSLTHGILFVNIMALSDATITGGYYFTNTEPRRDVKLGIVVTHFNRKNYVLPAMRRISETLLSDPDLQDKISLFVIDNSQNIEKHEAGKANVIPNKNLGGSGGFTRGLLHLKDNGYTHCLFMDDDASCEIEGIRRAYIIQLFAKADNLAVAGALMMETEPYRLYEKGAYFRKFCRPLKAGLDMRDIHHLLLAEVPEFVGYGAWWFFAFPIEKVTSFAFPFFVRGDDVLFSQMNDFEIITMNGIGVWGEDFAIKNAPTPIYHDTRCHLVQCLIQDRPTRLRAFKKAYYFFKTTLFTYHYGQCEAVILAIKHVNEGPDFWTNNIDMSKVRPLLSKMTEGERPAPMVLPRDSVQKHKRENWLRTLARILTLNGFLLPEMFIRNRTLLEPKQFTGRPYAVFRNRRVAYVLPNSNLGYIVEHDKKRFFKDLRAFISEIIKLQKNYGKLYAAYRKRLPELTSEAFWRDIYKDQ